MDMQVTISTNPRYTPSMFKDVDMPVRDLVECAAEKWGFPDKETYLEYLRMNRGIAAENSAKTKVIEMNGQKYAEDGTPIADFSKRYSFYPTGDPERDYQIQMGLNYNSTCYNGKNYWDYEKLTAAEDFTGMSAAEIYKAIYEKYKHCYGENFLDINAVPYARPPHSEDFYGELVDKFYDELEVAVGDTAARQKARREALYGDMSDYDVRAAIIEKYTSGRKPTNADLYKITAEFDRCGVGGGIHSPLSSVLTTDRSQVLHNYVMGIKTSVEDACALREAMLASPADSYMLDGIVRHSTGMGTANAKLYSALEQLREACEAFSDGISLGTVNTSGTKDDFVWVKL
ncbi:MAG: hypothetical protein NC192_02650 [Muribaculaceae bacterium]|nr:hypothetical protein [Muribaculaceae bacterium]